jgi:formylglycine-generating enzyme required for sulfatase activity
MIFTVLQCVGKAVVKNGLKGLINWLPFGEALSDIAANALDEWKQRKQDAERHAEVQALAQASGEEVRQQVARVVQEVAADQPAEARQALAAYLRQVPVTLRQSLRRPSDPTGTTVPAGLALNKPDDLLRLLPAKMPRFRPGDRPAGIGDWELVELLGIGGFGEVWKARNPHFDGVPSVALKFCLDPIARERLLRHEAAVLNQVMRQGKHSGIVTLEHSYLSTDPPCLEYEYVEGGDLAGLLTDWQQKGGLPPNTVLQLMHDLAETVAFAHHLNPPIVHRDLKLANILVQRSAKDKLLLKIADFGIGGLAATQALREMSQPSTRQSPLTVSLVRGAYTPLYASPQQIRGEKPDPRDDVHALGVIWYQLLTGDPTSGAPAGLQWPKQLQHFGMVDEQIALLGSCFEARAEDRPAEAAVLAGRLAGWLRAGTPMIVPPVKPLPPAEPIHPVPAPRREIPAKTRKKGSGAFLPVFAGLFVVVGVAVWFFLHGPRSDTQLKPFVNSMGMEFVPVKQGTFWMSKDGKNAQQEVTISKDFYLGKYPVTQAQWQAVMGYNPSNFSRTGGGKVEDISDEDLKQFPVEMVLWNDVQEFLTKLNALEKNSGWAYRLPTEAEWEYACRGGAPTSKEECSFDFYFAKPTNDLSSDQANFNGNFPAGNAPKGPYLARPCKVGSYPPNKLGLYDMHGNVCQWCEDSYHEGSGRVIRGGSWGARASSCRAAFRGRGPSGKYSPICGFRLARVPSGK